MMNVNACALPRARWTMFLVCLALLAGCASSSTSTRGKAWVSNMPAFDVKACFPHMDRDWGGDTRLAAMHVALNDLQPRLDECFNDHFFRSGPYSGTLKFHLVVQPDRSVKLTYHSTVKDAALHACIAETTELVELPKSSEVAGQTYESTYTLSDKGDRTLRTEASPMGRLVGSIRTRTLDACHCLEPYKDVEPPSSLAFRFRMTPESAYPQQIQAASQLDDPEFVACMSDHLARTPITKYDRELGAGYRFKFENSRAMSLEKILSDADEAANRRDYDRALELYDQVIRADPRHRRALSGRASVLLDSDRPAEALEVYLTLRQRHPEDGTIQYNTGRAFRSLGRHDEAYDAVSKALSIDEDFRYHHFIANIYLDRGNTTDALRSARRSRQLNPGFAQAYVTEARALHKRDENDAALAILEQALPLDHEEPSIFFDIAMVYFSLEQFDASLAAMDQGIDRGFDVALAHYNRGVILQHLNRRPEAALAFCKAAKLDPSLSDARKACEEGRMSDRAF